MASKVCEAPWQLCTLKWKPRLCDDRRMRTFNIDSTPPGSFISFPDEVRLPNTTRLIDILAFRKPYPGARHDSSFMTRFTARGEGTISLDLIRPDNLSFLRTVLPPSPVSEWYRNLLAQNPPNGLSLDYKDPPRSSTHCRTYTYTLLTVRWTTPPDLDTEGIYQFRLRTNLTTFETLSEPFRLADTVEGLEKIRQLQSQGLALPAITTERQWGLVFAMLAWGVVLLGMLWLARKMGRPREGRVRLGEEVGGSEIADE